MFSSLRLRVTAICVAIIVASLAALAGSSFIAIGSSSEQINVRRLHALAESNAQTIAQWVAFHQAMVAAGADGALGDHPLEALKQVEQAGHFSMAMAGFADRHALFSHDDHPLPPGYDVTTSPWYQPAVDANAVIMTEPYTDTESTHALIAFAAPLMRGHAFVGVIAAEMPLDSIESVVGTIHPSAHSYAFLSDAAGHILTSVPDAEGMASGSTLATDATPQLLNTVAASASPLRVTLRGRQVLLGNEPIEGTRWRLMIAVDRLDATASIRQILVTAVVILLIVSCISTLIVWLVMGGVLRRLHAVRDAMDEVSLGDGDLTRRLPSDGADEIGHIARSFNAFVDKLERVMQGIRASSEAVRDAAAEISSGNVDLSSRTEQQAASLGETVSNMDQLTSTVNQNAAHAQQANRMAMQASGSVHQGADVVRRVIVTIGAIAESSTRIEQIIATIEGIAFQTNILALNAAVEAARAGEQGRGFAVVAAEVRALAQRSASAAGEIKHLIQDAVGKVASGQALVGLAGDAMADISKSVSSVTEIIARISAASHAQNIDIGHVGRAISEMDDATQQNAALVEQASAAAISLADQADALQSVIATFRLSEVRAPG